MQQGNGFNSGEFDYLFRLMHSFLTDSGINSNRFICRDSGKDRFRGVMVFRGVFQNGSPPPKDTFTEELSQLLKNSGCHPMEGENLVFQRSSCLTFRILPEMMELKGDRVSIEFKKVRRN